MRNSPLHRILLHIRDFGLRGLHLRFLAGFSIYREMPVYQLDFTQLPAAVGAGLPLTFSLMNRSELDEYFAIPTESPSDPNILWDWGANCFLARHQGQIVSAVWIAERSFPLTYIHGSLDLSDDEVYVLEAFTLPAFRGKNLLPALLAHTCKHYLASGRRRAFTIIFSYNTASIRSFSKLGFKLCKLRGYWQLGPWKKDFERSLN
jgi:GNAT superfamily N-acetyltransferase